LVARLSRKTNGTGQPITRRFCPACGSLDLGNGHRDAGRHDDHGADALAATSCISRLSAALLIAFELIRT